MKKTLISLLLAGMPLGFVSAQSRLYDNEFDLGDVQLLDSPFKRALDLNTEVLLQYDVDRLLAPYLKAAGLEPKGESFPNWDGLDGHVGGHYLSALAIHYAATGNEEIKNRMDYMLGELAKCAVARGDGYVGGFPAEKCSGRRSVRATSARYGNGGCLGITSIRCMPDFATPGSTPAQRWDGISSSRCATGGSTLSLRCLPIRWRRCLIMSSEA